MSIDTEEDSMIVDIWSIKRLHNIELAFCIPQKFLYFKLWFWEEKDKRKNIAVKFFILDTYQWGFIRFETQFYVDLWSHNILHAVRCDAIVWEHFFMETMSWTALAWKLGMQTSILILKVIEENAYLK